jgi:N6-adenosine-specific RNA methylase IME4
VTVLTVAEPLDGLAARSPGAVSPTGLALPPDLSYEAWEDIGKQLAAAERSVMWWVADWLLYGENTYGRKYEMALATTALSYGTLANYRSVAARVESSRRREHLSFGHHAEVAALDPDEQDRWLDRAQGEQWTREDLRQAIRRERRQAFADSFGAAPTLPAGLFDVLYVDPPWRYEHPVTERDSIEAHYPTLALEEICALPIADIAADDAVLFLWTTNPKLAEAIKVIEAWGFDYRTNLTWVKDWIGMGYWLRQRHELLLIAKRGEPPVPAEEDRPDSVLEAPRRAHSEKPEQVYELIEAMYPNARRVELFAREVREGWTSWGNEVPALAAAS